MPVTAALIQPRHPGFRAAPHLQRHEVRLSRRIGAGLSPAMAARAEGLAEAELQAILTKPYFAQRVADCAAMDALPEDEARGLLTGIARSLLMGALMEGDLAAAAFILREEQRGRDSARRLADGVVVARRRAVQHPPDPAPEPPAAPRPASVPADPVDRAAWRKATRLREALLREYGIRNGTSPAPEPATPEPPSPAPPASPPSLNRRQRRRLAAIKRRQPGAPYGDRPPPRARSP